jgi:hypothetical protein
MSHARAVEQPGTVLRGAVRGKRSLAAQFTSEGDLTMRRPSLASERRVPLLRTAWMGAALGATLMIPAVRPALAGCMDDVQHLQSELGIAPGTETPATTESRGISPDVTSRLTGSGVPGGNPIAVRRTEVLGLLQSARAASAQGNEDECLAQLGKAQDVMRERQP